MADTRTGCKVERTPSGELLHYGFCYNIDIGGVVETFKVDVYPSEMQDPQDLDEAISIADGAAAAWRTKQTANPDPAVGIDVPYFSGEVTWP